eukprot:6053440-Pleurochrysis_carterae.AAC.1
MEDGRNVEPEASSSISREVAASQLLHIRSSQAPQRSRPHAAEGEGRRLRCFMEYARALGLSHEHALLLSPPRMNENDMMAVASRLKGGDEVLRAYAKKWMNDFKSQTPWMQSRTLDVLQSTAYFI